MNYAGRYKNMYEAYPDLVKDCQEYGTPFNPRGLSCFEMRPGSFAIEDSKDTIYGTPDRKLNFKFFAVETLGYLAGLDSKWYAELLVRVNQNMSKFISEYDGKLLGAYGPMIKESLAEAVETLVNDRDSRQAVISIWSPGIKNKRHVNMPCTLSLQFFTRNRKLDCLATMRSNDLNWGTAYDVPAFCTIQSVIASCLDLQPGQYNHVVGSLHLYENSIPSLATEEGRRKMKTAPMQHIPYVEWPSDLTPCERITAIIENSERFLNEAYDHIIMKQLPIADFESSREDPNRCAIWKWFLFWGNCMRFSWKDYLNV